MKDEFEDTAQPYASWYQGRLLLRRFTQVLTKEWWDQPTVALEPLRPLRSRNISLEPEEIMAVPEERIKRHSYYPAMLMLILLVILSVTFFISLNQARSPKFLSSCLSGKVVKPSSFETIQVQNIGDLNHVYQAHGNLLLLYGLEESGKRVGVINQHSTSGKSIRLIRILKAYRFSTRQKKEGIAYSIQTLENQGFPFDSFKLSELLAICK